MAPRKIPISIQPGVLKSQSEYGSPGRYIDADKVRFDEGQPEKIGGWVLAGWETTTGTPRDALAWRDNNGNKYVATGSYLKLQVLDNDGDSITDITPVRDSGTLGADPFTTTDTSAEVSVADTGHGLEQGDYVVFSGATAVGGITIDGEYTVTTVTDSDNYVITHSSAATSSATGGGGSVAYVYLLTIGEIDTVEGGGWGVGTFGTGTFGTERTGGSYLTLATRWSLDTYGEDLLAMTNNQSSLYRWDTSAGGRSAVVSNAPPGNFCFVTSERCVIVLGADGDPMRISGSDDESITDWTPSVTNKAFSRLLQTGSRLICGGRLGQGINLVWSDTAVYVMQFANNNTIVYSTRISGEGDDFGIIGSGAFVCVGGISYWMSTTDFKMFAGSPQRMPNVDDIRDYVFDDINSTQAEKCYARYDPVHHEIWFHYPTANSMECDAYVIFSTTEGHWTTGTMDRSCFVTQVDQDSVIYGFDTDGDAYQHEIGTDANGEALPWYIETGYSDIADGNQLMDVFGFIPDFKSHAEDITLTLTAIDYPQDASTMDSVVTTISEAEGIDDFRLNGRAIKYRMEGSAVGSTFRIGRIRAEINEAGGRR